MSDREYIWIQFGYDDPDAAPVIQSFPGTEAEARDSDGIVTPGSPWYRYEDKGTGKLEDGTGPFYFNT